MVYTVGLGGIEFFKTVKPSSNYTLVNWLPRKVCDAFSLPHKMFLWFLVYYKLLSQEKTSNISIFKWFDNKWLNDGWKTYFFYHL